MVKKILYGDDAHNYIGLARHLWKQLKEGKKVYNVGDATIELQKGDFNYIRIRAKGKPETNILLCALYRWEGEKLYFEFWRVLNSGNIDIIILPQESITGSQDISEVLCGRFNLSNPLEFIVYLKHNNLIMTIQDESYHYYNSPRIDKALCNYDYRQTRMVDIFHIQLDFESMTAFANKSSSYYEFEENHWINTKPQCDNINPDDWHTIYGFYVWWERAHVRKNLHKKIKYVFDIYADGGIQEAYISMEKQQTWYNIWSDPWNPMGETYGECPPSGPNTNFWGEPDPAWKPNPRVREYLHSELIYNKYKLILEDTNRIYCLQMHDNGLYIDYDILNVSGNRNFDYSVDGVRVLNKDQIFFVYYKNEQDGKLYPYINGYGNLDEANVSYDYPKQCVESVNPYASYESDVYKYCSHPYQWVIFPSISLLRKNDIVFCWDIRFIKTFSYWMNAFESESKGHGSIVKVKDNYEKYESFILAFQDPFKPEWYRGILVVDDADYGYGGLGWSNPLFYGGPYFLPFTRWKDLQTPHFITRKNFAPGLSNAFYRNKLIIPIQNKNGFFIGRYGTPPGIKDALAGSLVFQDMVLLQTNDKKWYINGEDLKSVDEKKLLGGK